MYGKDAYFSHSSSIMRVRNALSIGITRLIRTSVPWPGNPSSVFGAPLARMHHQTSKPRSNANAEHQLERAIEAGKDIERRESFVAS
jgi:hypothetical protein